MVCAGAVASEPASVSASDVSVFTETADALESFLLPNGCLVAVGDGVRSRACSDAGDLAAVGVRGSGMAKGLASKLIQALKGGLELQL